jgi:hypothetical protein
MKKNLKFWVTLTAIAALALGSSGCTKLKARDNLNKGVQAFKAAKYQDAIGHFKESIELDPTYPVARVYLATAYRSQWVPGSSDKENLAFLQSAKSEFQKVLDGDKTNKIAIAQMASINFDEVQGINDPVAKEAKLDEAATWYKRQVEVDPNNAQAFYSLGVVAWMKWYPAFGKARADMGMKMEDKGPLKDAKKRAELRDRWLPTINGGLESLQKALNIDKEYDDAMAYMNLLTRERADLADNEAAYKADIAAADKWVDQALETKRVKAQRALNKPGGIKTDE